jgi:hypothetical protein
MEKAINGAVQGGDRVSVTRVAHGDIVMVNVQNHVCYGFQGAADAEQVVCSC